MFSFFGNKKHSLLEFTSRINNNPTLEQTETSSSMDSHYRDSRQDDESSLGSHCSEVDAVVLVEEAQDELGVETSLSEEKQNEQLNRKLQQLPLKDLHKLVGIASEDERFDAQSKPDLPPYKIRRKIATKVMAKKVTKGYSILEETCTVCDMPLMEGRGKKECRVCPAIIKWMEKNDSDPHDIQNEMNVDAAQTGVVADDQRNEHREEIMSDATPDFKSFMTADIRKRIMDLTPIPEKLEFSNEAVVNTTEQPSKVKETKSKPDKSQSTMKSEKKQQEKILEANDKASVGNVDGDATPDFKSFMTADIRKRIMDLTPIPERLEFSNEAVVNTTEQPSKVKETKSKPDKSQSTMKSEKKQQEKILEANDKASVGNVDGSISVEDRARQIIMEVRKKGGWDENAYPNIGSPIGSQVDEAAYYQGVAEARAELIIKRARLSLHKDVEVCSEIEKKSDVATPGLIVKKAKESLRKDDMIDEGSVRHAESIVKKAKESLEKVESPKQRTTAPPLTPMSKLRKKQSSWLNYTASPFKLTSWDAARIIQSFARMVLQRKVFLEHLSDKRTKMYRDMLTGKWKPRKVDIVFESRSKSKEEDIEGGSNEVVQRTDEPAKLREPVESRLVKERWPREPVENREGDPDGQVVRHIDSMHVDNRIEPKNADLRVSVDPVSENDKVETSNADNYIVQAGSYTSTIATRQGNEDVSIVDNGARYTNNAASRFNYEYQQQANTAASSMLDLNQLQIDHQVIDETTSNLPQAEMIYDAEVVNASDMVHCSTPMMYAGDGSRAAAMRACIHNPPVFQAEVMKHAGDVANCVNPISAKLVRKNDPPAMGAGAEDDKAQESHHPKRNVFAKVACSFDDAVSKVVSKLTCSGSGEVIGLKSQYKSAPASPPLANGSYFEESRRNAASYSIMYRTSLGWTIVNESCSQCQMPMMKRPDDQKVLCVVCDEADTSDNATLGTMLRSEAPGHGSVISQMRSVAGSQIMKPIEPVPASIGTKNMTNIHIAAPRQRAPIDPEPANDAVSLPPINRSKKKEKKRLKHSSARSCVSVVEPPSYIKAPTTQSNQPFHHSSARSCVSVVEPPSYIKAPTTQSNQPFNHRRMSANDSDCSRSVGHQSVVSHQWKMTKESCPRCSTHMMKNAYENTHHCHSCGTVVANSFNTASLVDYDNEGGQKNPFVLAHQEMISSPRAMTQSQKQQHPTFYDYQPSTNPLRPVGQGLYSFHRDEQINPLQRRGHTQTLSLHFMNLPTPNPMRNHHFNDPTPNHNRMRQNNPQQQHHHYVKENSYGEANMSHQMTAADKAKQQMEDGLSAMRRKMLNYN